MSNSIDQLIRDLVVEDLFKAKYTSRQRSIFCQNMYAKVYTFIKENNKEQHERVEQLEDELEDALQEIEEYKRAYEQLKKAPSMYLEFLYSMTLGLYVLYIYFMWNNAYSVKDDTSINETKAISDKPYNSA